MRTSALQVGCLVLVIAAVVAGVLLLSWQLRQRSQDPSASMVIVPQTPDAHTRATVQYWQSPAAARAGNGSYAHPYIFWRPTPGPCLGKFLLVIPEAFSFCISPALGSRLHPGDYLLLTWKQQGSDFLLLYQVMGIMQAKGQVLIIIEVSAHPWPPIPQSGAIVPQFAD